jgi:hypothetical protein
MHSKFHEQIDNKVSVPVVSTLEKKSGLRVPTPSNYGGSTDTKTFECWLNALLCWLIRGDTGNPWVFFGYPHPYLQTLYPHGYGYGVIMVSCGLPVNLWVPPEL